MTRFYTVAGRQVPAYQLSILSLAGWGGLAYGISRIGAKPPVNKMEDRPKIEAGSKEEEIFIQQFLKEAGEAKH